MPGEHGVAFVASPIRTSRSQGDPPLSRARGRARTLKARVSVALLALTVTAAATLLALQRPFAFYSPDVSFHAAKLLRASHGEIFRDPVTGTPSIYPPAFHVLFGSLNRLLRLDPPHLAVLIEVVDFVGLMVAAFFLARAVIGDSGEAAVCTLCLPLLFYSPTGRHVLLVSPSNFALVLQLAGFAVVCTALRSGRDSVLAAGALLSGVAVNVVWYDAVPAVALLSTVAVERVWRTRDPRRALPLLAFLAPFVFTAVHLMAVREVCPPRASW